VLAVTAHDNIRLAVADSNRLVTASDLGVSHDAMARMRDAGVLERIIPGVYVGAHHAQHPLIDVAGWTMGHPAVVGCLFTTAVYHDLTDAFARGTWLFIPKGNTVLRSRVVSVHPIQVVPWIIDPQDDAENGIVTVPVHGVNIRITDPDRTTVDLWRYPHHVTSEHALQALQRCVRRPGFHLPAFARLAQRLQVWSRIEPVLQGMVMR
jgi:predicted transcriptional regulator of viral defense system